MSAVRGSRFKGLRPPQMRIMPKSDNRSYKHNLFGRRRDFLKLAPM
jgi:hypothetical protein